MSLSGGPNEGSLATPTPTATTATTTTTTTAQSPAQGKQVPNPSHFATFEYKSIEHLSLLNYQRPTSNLFGRQAFAFYGDGNVWKTDQPSAASAAVKSSALSAIQEAVATVAKLNKNKDCGALDRKILVPVVSKPVPANTNQPAAPAPEKAKPILSFPAAGGMMGDTAATIFQFKADDTTKGAQTLWSQVYAQLEESRTGMARAEARLALAQQGLLMARRQNMQTAQDLAAAVGALGAADVKTVTGQWPALVHLDSTPLLTTRIEFPDNSFDEVPRVVVGMQTSDPSAVVLVCTSKVNAWGFTVHADLASTGELRQGDSKELLKCLITWMAVGRRYDAQNQKT